MHWQTKVPLKTVFAAAATLRAPTTGDTRVHPVTIRSAMMDDIDAIVKIGREGFIHAHPGAFTADDLETVLNRWFSYETTFYDMLSPRTYYFVAQVDGTICGMVRMSESEKPSYLPSTYPKIAAPNSKRASIVLSLT